MLAAQSLALTHERAKPMPRALHRTSESPPAKVPGGKPLRPNLHIFDHENLDLDNDAGAGVMTDPLHPMHRELLARISTPPAKDQGLSRPARLAIIFYAALASWGLVWLLSKSASALL